MIKAYINKLIFILFSVVLLLPLYTPFSIFANGSLSPPFVGFNINVIDMETSQSYRLYGTMKEKTNGKHTWTCSSYNSNGVCRMWRNETIDGATYQNITDIEFNNSYLAPFNVSNRVLYQVEIILDNNYVGYFDINYQIDNSNYSNTIYINGNSTTYNINPSQGSTQPINISISNINLTLNNDNDWYFPIESYPFIKSCFDNNLELSGINNYNSYFYPTFKLYQNDVVASLSSLNETEFYLIFYSNDNIRNLERFNERFSFSNSNFIAKSIDVNNPFTYTDGQARFLLCKVLISCSPNSTSYFSYVGNRNGFYFMPVYSGNGLNLSTDFALSFGLSNSFLENINIIANGNTQSNQSSSQADTTNQQANTVFTQEEQLINNAENQLASDLQTLDIQNQNNNLFGNSKFIASANWVKTQFDTLTNNNAFGYLITFSLVIGLSLVIIGKLRG